jgi:phytoene synthase
MINRTLFKLFKEGSKTYFYSSIFFPTYIKKDVFTLYGFVRKADNYVDSIPQDINGFYEFKNKYYDAVNGKKTNDIVINSFVNLMKKKNIDPKWVDAFLNSMEMDITKSTYENMNETLEYIHGSAEVIGLMMAKIINLPKESYEYAKYLGRSMQYINFIRDIAEDIKLRRIYFPTSDMKKFGIIKLDYDFIKDNKEKFTNFINKQLEYYCNWQKFAEKGYKYIPKKYLVSIKTASEMYNWTAEQIYSNPLVVYNTKVKPQISKIISYIIMNIIDPSKPKGKNPFICFNKRPTSQHDYE